MKNKLKEILRKTKFNREKNISKGDEGRGARN